VGFYQNHARSQGKSGDFAKHSRQPSRPAIAALRPSEASGSRKFPGETGLLTRLAVSGQLW
jgi:hypothetical protein